MNEISGIPNPAQCPNCGEGNDQQRFHCVHCGQSLQKRSKRIKISTILMGLIAFALAGVVVTFIIGGFESRLVGSVNGVTYEKLDAFYTIQSACCKGGGCGGGEKVGSLDPKVEKEARVKALQYYEAKKGKNGADARVTDFGCHIQVDIVEKDKVLLSLTYDRGEVQEI